MNNFNNNSSIQNIQMENDNNNIDLEIIKGKPDKENFTTTKSNNPNVNNNLEYNQLIN